MLCEARHTPLFFHEGNILQRALLPAGQGRLKTRAQELDRPGLNPPPPPQQHEPLPLAPTPTPGCTALSLPPRPTQASSWPILFPHSSPLARQGRSGQRLCGSLGEC